MDLNKQLQKQIIAPFAAVRAFTTIPEVTITGHVKKSLANKVKTAITQPIRWARAELWDMYDVLVNIKKIADAAYAAGDFQLCQFKAEQAYFIMRGIIEDAPDMWTVHDRAFDIAVRMLQLSLEILRTISAIQLGAKVSNQNRLPSEFETHSMVLRELESSFTHEEAFTWLMSLSLAYLSIGNVHMSSLLWSTAMQHATDGKMPGLKQIADYCAALVKKLGATRQRECVVKLVKLFPACIVKLREPKRYINDMALCERYVVKQLCPQLSCSDKMSHLVREGISIRAMSSGGHPSDAVLGMFATSGKGSFTISDIDIMEVLLFNRIRTETRLGGFRTQTPTFCQIGHFYIDDTLESTIDRYRAEMSAPPAQ